MGVHGHEAGVRSGETVRGVESDSRGTLPDSDISDEAKEGDVEEIVDGFVVACAASTRALRSSRGAKSSRFIGLCGIEKRAGEEESLRSLFLAPVCVCGSANGSKGESLGAPAADRLGVCSEESEMLMGGSFKDPETSHREIGCGIG
jgi:hypothetical protein